MINIPIVFTLNEHRAQSSLKKMEEREYKVRKEKGTLNGSNRWMDID